MLFSLTRDPYRDGQKVLCPIGEMDLNTVGHLRGVLTASLCDPAVSSLLIDMSCVTFLDCAGIGALVEARQTAERHRKRYGVIHPRGLPRRVLELSGVLSYLSPTTPHRDRGLQAAVA
ncbi:anti-anti-sigma factor [Micromonospora coriariae]|uniref:Anti-anti-sigma factor n=1 Tax=Micromonospora coriariae TaxID=285665 RepID=A0A1C4U651_9ACTN|nr:STAS domain-containing protein [Micromonospora coriariae]SCE67089.1 anti-anti-sigma factor [Micromonospora coriariae]